MALPFLHQLRLGSVSLVLLIVLAIVAQAGAPQAALAAPTLRIVSPYTTPDQGWTVRGVIAFAVDASDPAGISRVEFFVDGQLRATDTGYPYNWLWNTRAASVGSHTLRAVAYNTQSQSTAVQQVVNVAAPLVDRPATGSAVTEGLLPPIQPVIPDIRLRDTSIARGGDGAYYLTGTGSDNDAWYHNEGINLWRSTDLQTWSYIGLVWSFERDGTASERAWGTLHDKPYRAVWAPEIAYLKGTYYILWSFPGRGTKLLRSTTGRPEGPYANNRPDGGTLFGNIDGSLFEDTNGTVYLVYENGNVVKLNAALTAFDSSVYRLGQGDEGGFMFKHNGKYYLSVAKFMSNGRYSSYVGIASSPTGPFSQWHEALPTGGHNSYLYDSQGALWGSYFGNDKQAPFQTRPSVVKMTVNSDGTLKPSPSQSPPPTVGPTSGPTLTPTVGPAPTVTPTPSPGSFVSLIARHSGKAADVSGGSTADGAAVVQWASGGEHNQQWLLQDGGGYVRVVNRNSGKCLDVEARSTADGAHIVQWTCGTGSNQQFRLVDVGGGYVQLVARHSGKCLDVEARSTADGASIVQWTCGSGSNQHWERRPAS